VDTGALADPQEIWGSINCVVELTYSDIPGDIQLMKICSNPP